MYLSNIKLWNFRKFGSNDPFDLEKPHLNLNLTKGLNVLIGENDSGKTAIIDAIKLVLKTHSFEWIKVLDEDFYTDANRFRIELTFSDLADLEAKNFIEWLGWEGEGEHAMPYLKLMYDVRRKDSRIFPSDVLAGVDDEGYQLTAEARDFLKVTYLKPLRDALSELIPKKNSRLSQIFQGHEAFKGKDRNHYLLDIFNDFNISVEKYFEAKKFNGEDLDDVNGKELKIEIDKYVKAFYDDSKETEIKIIEGSLKSILEKLELSVKDDYNVGLGTLNRLFMASELLHLKKKDWNGIRLGLIEELEAHLHPQAQMQVVEALQNQKDIQLILTTHSPNLASKVKLKNLIICNNTSAFPLGQKHTKLSKKDYEFLECFLDVTKSNLFFAKGVIFVEGWAEEIFLSSFAKQLKRQEILSKDLTEAGVSIVNVGSTAFLRYSKVFLRKIEGHEMNVPVSIITDVDVREYVGVDKCDSADVLLKTKKGKAIKVYNKIDPAIVSARSSEKINSLEKKYNHQKVKAFVAPNWTFEYSLHKSGSLSEFFKTIVRKVHKQVSETDFEADLAKKLILKTLNKTQIAYLLANLLTEDLKKSEEEKTITIQEDDPSIVYLINAIKYACGN